MADVYHGGKKKGVIVEMSNGDQLQLVYPNFSGELYSAIGYDLDELCADDEHKYRTDDAKPRIHTKVDHDGNDFLDF